MARTSTMTQAEALAVLGLTPAQAAAFQVLSEVEPDAPAKASSKASSKASGKASGKKAAAPKVAEPSLDDRIQEGLTGAGLTFRSGRTYLSTSLVEAQARLLRAKSPGFEIVNSEVEGARTAAVLVVRDDKGRVFAQNLTGA